ncbi:MAG: Gfo/Idh/MocA family oxidoreductase [Planctomycetota bacterium]
MTQLENDLRVAVIGMGHLGKIHAKLLANVAGAELVAVCDPFESAAADAGAQFGVPFATDYHGITDTIDAAIIAAPTPCHAEIAFDLLEQRKHLLIEKPLTNDATSSKRLAMLAEMRGVVLQVGHVERFNPAFAALGEFGRHVKFVEATRASRFPGRCLDVGVVMDLMIHDLDLVLSLTDAPVKSVHASGVSLVSDHEDIAEARVEFECGLIANVKASRVSPSPTREMTLYADAGSARIDFSTPALSTVANSVSVRSGTFDLAEETENPLGYADQLFDEHLVCETATLEPTNAIQDELHDFVVSIQSGSQPIVTGESAARAVALADQILDAIDHRSQVVARTDRSSVRKAA